MEEIDRSPAPVHRVLIFARYPRPGRAKTRMIPSLGSEGAAALHRNMTEHTISILKPLLRSGEIGVELHYQGARADEMRGWLGESLPLAPQCEGDLGDRMAGAFGTAFSEGADRVIIVGTDCPGLTAGIIAEAFELLDECDAVFGPATDGGYYLIGLKREVPALFRDIPWGTGDVLAQTLDRSAREGISTAQTQQLADVDRPEDLPVWENVQGELISVVIPALNEEAVVANAVDSATAASNVEVIVVDGGSTDRTAENARSSGAEVVTGPRGRAAQMNLGASSAGGKIILFLHADTILPPGYDAHVRRTLEDTSSILGAFRFRTDGSGFPIRVIERLANWRARFAGMPYGDQALFLRSETFRQEGGFSDMPFMEDFEFVRRLGRKGKVAIVPADALTSARRWRDMGVWRTSLLNQFLITCYKFGVSIDRLERWYRRRGI